MRTRYPVGKVKALRRYSGPGSPSQSHRIWAKFQPSEVINPAWEWRLPHGSFPPPYSPQPTSGSDSFSSSVPSYQGSLSDIVINCLVSCLAGGRAAVPSSIPSMGEGRGRSRGSRYCIGQRRVSPQVLRLCAECLVTFGPFFCGQ